MDESFQAALQRLRACAQRTQDAAARVNLKRDEVARIEASKGNPDMARRVLAFLEQALAKHCGCLETLIEHVEHLSRGE
jgi:hypothetical protein